MKFHIIMAINPKSYDAGLITKMDSVYTSLCKLHVSIMGPKTKEILPFLPKDSLESITEITAPIFNYSYVINRSLRTLYSKGTLQDDDLIVLVDSWNVCSLIQMEVPLRTLDFSKNFVHIEVYKDAVESEINKNSQKFMLTALTRLKITKEMKRPNPQKLIPMPILSMHHFREAGGLEEKMFTDLSRLFLMDYLDKSGINRVNSCSDGIRLSYEPVYPNEQIQQDMTLFNSLRSIEDSKIILPANIGYDWGSPERLKYLKVINNVPYWSEQTTVKNTIIINQPPIIEEIPEQPIEKPRIIPMKTKVPVSGFELKFQDTLIAVRNTIKDVALSSNILKNLFLQYGPVTIFTDRKSFPAIEMIESFMVKNIFDIPAYQASPIDFSKFKKIYRISGFTKSVDIPGAEDVTEISDHNPYCFTPAPTRKIPDSSICISMAASPEGYRRVNPDMQLIISKISEKIISYNIPTFLLALDNERSIIQNITTKYTNTGKLSLAINRDISEACSILNFCKLLITHPGTDMSWLAYAMKKNSIVVYDSTTEKMPEVPWFHSIEYTEDECVNKVIKMAIQSM